MCIFKKCIVSNLLKLKSSSLTSHLDLIRYSHNYRWLKDTNVFRQAGRWASSEVRTLQATAILQLVDLLHCCSYRWRYRHTQLQWWQQSAPADWKLPAHLRYPAFATGQKHRRQNLSWRGPGDRPQKSVLLALGTKSLKKKKTILAHRPMSIEKISSDYRVYRE